MWVLSSTSCFNSSLRCHEMCVVCSGLSINCVKQLIVLKHKILLLSEMETDSETNCKLIEKISWRGGPVILGVEHFGEREECLYFLNS